MELSEDQLISDISESASVPKATVKAVFGKLSHITTSQLQQGAAVVLPGIGKLEVSDRPARNARDSTGVAITLPAAKVVKFVANNELKKAVDK